MSTDYYEAESSAERPRSFLSMLLLLLLAFIIGLVVMAWTLARWSDAATFLGVKTAPPIAEQPVVRIVPAGSPADHATPQAAVDSATSRRVDQLEQQVARIDTQTRAAVGNAGRAEGLLIAFAARRALDRGARLDYLEGLLRQRFGDTQPEAVATILTASRQPVTLAELQEGLDKLGPSLAGGGPDESWWNAIKGELGSLITIRKAGVPSTVPSDRLARAKSRLDAGEVDVALTEVIRLPGREKAHDWILAARRYVSARRALDTIETAALLEPRGVTLVDSAAATQPAPAPAR
jgi:hypothetical protein